MKFGFFGWIYFFKNGMNLVVEKFLVSNKCIEQQDKEELKYVGNGGSLGEI